MKDSFGREIEYLRLSVTDLCNLRCTYCMGPDGICKKKHEEMLTEEEMVLAVKAAVTCGIRKVRITGGEPLVKRNILSICRRIGELEGVQELCLTTNGTLLEDKAQALLEAGVTHLNISLDTLQPEKYSKLTAGGNLSDALKGLETSLQLGFHKIKVNVVLIGGVNDDEIEELAKLTLRYPVDVRFIELMPMNSVQSFGREAYVSAEIVKKRLPQLCSEETEGVAKMYSLPGALGKVGLITPLSSHFCATCNRIRITADGKVKPCLHGADEYDIKGKTQEEMRVVLREAILAKPLCHDILSYENRSGANREMNRIGG